MRYILYMFAARMIYCGSTEDDKDKREKMLSNSMNISDEESSIEKLAKLSLMDKIHDAQTTSTEAGTNHRAQKVSDSEMSVDGYTDTRLAAKISELSLDKDGAENAKNQEGRVDFGYTSNLVETGKIGKCCHNRRIIHKKTKKKRKYGKKKSPNTLGW